jgi:ribosome-associated protein
MDIRKLQRAIVDGLEDVKAQDILVFNTEALSPLFERVVIASGTSNRQTKALAASVRDTVKARGMQVLRTEGEDNGEWIIVDCGAAVAHIMQPSIRSYYHLEEIWGGKPVHLKRSETAPRGLPKASEEAPAVAAGKSAARKPGASAAAAGKAAAKKTAFKKTAVKKAAVKKTAAKKAAAKKTARVTGVARSVPVSGAGTKPAQRPAAGRKTAAVAPVARKVVARKAAAPKPAATRSAAATPARKAAPRPAAKKAAAVAPRASRRRV